LEWLVTEWLEGMATKFGRKPERGRKKGMWPIKKLNEVTKRLLWAIKGL
jgi:hypothetical protein